MNSNTLDGDLLLKDVALFTTSAPCQLSITKVSDERTLGCLSRNQNLHPEAIQALFEVLGRNDWDHMLLGLYGDNSANISAVFTQRVREDGTIAPAPSSWWEQDSKEIWGEYLTYLIRTAPAYLDPLGPVSWEMFFTALPTWQGSLHDLTQVVQRVLSN